MSSSMPDNFNVNPPDLPPLAPTYSHISIAQLLPSTKLLSFAGQVGHDSISNKTPPDFASQVAVALANVDKCLSTAGATKQDIVQVRQYVVGLSKQSPEEKKARADAIEKFMGPCKPPSTLIGVEGLAVPELLYEIEIVAVVHK
ncbi:YjgF-like protein [Rhizodiscina lignyota]|uniref:YjgF-like protein n=1 Tax=Rhizodiscina lignyota TaxID=1504668 RepID=A0A9P4IJ08_9PEZI|nr:YjgF-like protein [Rhizodiscina lignyota]